MKIINIKFILLIHFIGNLIVVQAQGKLSIGLSTQMLNTKLIVNASNINAKGAYRPTSVLFAEYNFWRKMAVHSGLGYTMMTQNSDAFKNNYHYLAMPLYLKHGKLEEGKKIAFTTFYGTNLHYLLSSNHIDYDGVKTDLTGHSRKFHLDFVFGGGLKFKLSDKIILEALTSFSLGSMVNKYNPAYVDVNNLNTGYSLNLSYKFK